MLPLIQFKKELVNKIKPPGFVILTTTLLLSMASITFTMNMASSQLLDNQIIANYYRNNEAFVNAESGINFVLSQLDDPVMSQLLLSDLSVAYPSSPYHYIVNVELINVSQLAITSVGTSVDGSAQRKISLVVDSYLNFPIPTATVSTNGKLNLDNSVSVNDGCEGLSSSDCQASGNVAENMLLSNPALEMQETVPCSGGHVGNNIIGNELLVGDSTSEEVKLNSEATGYDWRDNSFSDGSTIAGISTDPSLTANSLFEATFAMQMNEDNIAGLSAVTIDTSHGDNCSQRLQALDDEDVIILIKGDCDISGLYTGHNYVFTIGSTESPKLIFIEGGTFNIAPNAKVSVIGMLYFLPGTHDLVDASGNLVDSNGDLVTQAIQVTDSNINLGVINVNGALLSEYTCSYASANTVNGDSIRQHLSIRFDKLVLDKLYSDLGVEAIESGYRLSPGTWRDF